MTPAEAMQSHLAELSEDLAQAVQTLDETSRTLQALAETGEARHNEVMEAIAATNKGAADLHREVTEMMALFRNYVEQTAALRSEVRKVVSHGQR